MINLREMTYEYVESLKYVKEIKRSIHIEPSFDILAIIGPRRVGKTFLMLKKVKELLEKNENALYINFDEPSLRKIEVRKLAEIIRKEFPVGKVYLFLDEIQEWRNWDFNLRWLHDVKDFYICITGSSSTLQSSEIPTRLRGRYISKTILPLSFKEIVNFEIKSFRERGRVLKLLEDYIKWGGFPEIWIYRSREKIISLLETVFYRDIIERFRIKNIEVFEDLFYYVLSNFSNKVTWNSIKRLFEGRGIRIDTKTVIKYVNYMKFAFLIFIINKFTYSEKEKIISPKKIYVVDTCFSILFEKPLELGRIMENIVFIELLRKYGNGIYYYETRKGEIDFIVKKGLEIKEVIEVCYDCDLKHIEKMYNALKELKVKKGTIITWDEEDLIKRNEIEIKIIPLWKWLLL